MLVLASMTHNAIFMLVVCVTFSGSRSCGLADGAANYSSPSAYGLQSCYDPADVSTATVCSGTTATDAGKCHMVHSVGGFMQVATYT